MCGLTHFPLYCIYISCVLLYFFDYSYDISHIITIQVLIMMMMMFIYFSFKFWTAQLAHLLTVLLYLSKLWLIRYISHPTSHLIDDQYVHTKSMSIYASFLAVYSNDITINGIPHCRACVFTMKKVPSSRQFVDLFCRPHAWWSVSSIYPLIWCVEWTNEHHLHFARSISHS